MTSSYFITGTDTGVGKTWVTLGLMACFKQQGFKVVGMKPVAAGCEWRQGQWHNEDAIRIQHQASIDLPYSVVNPYAFKQPVSPHLACQGENIELSLIAEQFNGIQQQADRILVEGAGGWYSPLSETLDNCQLAQSLDIPVILVVAIRLGCINQALLSWRAIQASCVKCAGWIAVLNDRDMRFTEENIQYIQQSIKASPLLGVIPYMEKMDAEKIAHSLKGF